MRLFFLCIILVITAIGIYTLYEISQLIEFKHYTVSKVTPGSYVDHREGEEKRIVQALKESGVDMISSKLFETSKECVDNVNLTADSYRQKGFQEDVIKDVSSFSKETRKSIYVRGAGINYYIQCITNDEIVWGLFVHYKLTDEQLKQYSANNKDPSAEMAISREEVNKRKAMMSLALQAVREHGGTIVDTRKYKTMNECIPTIDKVVTAYKDRGVQESDIGDGLSFMGLGGRVIAIRSENLVYYLICTPAPEQDSVDYMQISVTEEQAKALSEQE